MIIALIFGVLNFIAVVFLDINASRAMRAITSVVVFIYYLFFLRCNHKWLFTVLLLIILTNIGLVFYGFDYGMLLFTMTSVVVYLLFSLKAFLQLEWMKVKWFEYLSYLLIFAFNLYSFNYLSDIISPLFEEVMMFYMLKLMGFVGITMCLIVGFYNSTRASFKSAYFMYAVFGFVFSDFCAMIAFYFEIAPQIFFFLDRGLFLFGIYFLMRYAYEMHLEQQSVSN